MSKTTTYKKIRINYNSPENLLEDVKVNNYNNKRKLLSRINNSYSLLQIQKIKITKDSNYDVKKSESIIFNNNKKGDNYIKEFKEEKEKKDLEKIYKKWNNQELILSKINGRYMTYKEENLKAADEAINKLKFSIWEKTLNEKIGENSKEIKKIEINSKLKANRFSKMNLMEEMKNMDNVEIDLLSQKAKIILDKKNDNIEEKCEFIIQIGEIIEKEVKNNKNNFILPGKAIYSNNIIINFLGYFGSELSLNNIKTYIEEEPTNGLLREITFNIILSGFASQKIYLLTLENTNYELKFRQNIAEWKIFLRNLKLKISKSYNINPNDLYFFDQKIQNKFEIKLLIYKQKPNNLENTLNQFYIKAKSSTLLNYAILSPSVLEAKFSKNIADWPKTNLMRGGRRYYPPYDWIGIALKVKDKYGDNKWLGNENKEGEWAVGYHGVGKGKIFSKILNIIYDNLKEGHGQLYDHYLNVENTKDEYQNCGEGVYLAPNIEEALKYADKTYLGWYKVQFQFVIMARVNPEKIRSPGGSPVIWILNGNYDEVRPYRLLIKKTYT